MYRYYAPFLFFCSGFIRSNLRFLRMLMHMQYCQKQGIKNLHENVSFSSCEINCFDSLKIIKEKLVIWASWNYIDYWHNVYFRCIEDPFYDVHVLCVYLCILMHTSIYTYILHMYVYVCIYISMQYTYIYVFVYRTFHHQVMLQFNFVFYSQQFTH